MLSLWGELKFYVISMNISLQKVNNTVYSSKNIHERITIKFCYLKLTNVHVM